MWILAYNKFYSRFKELYPVLKTPLKKKYENQIWDILLYEGSILYMFPLDRNKSNILEINPKVCN